jgi:hypothetical protein
LTASLAEIGGGLLERPVVGDASMRTRTGGSLSSGLVL